MECLPGYLAPGEKAGHPPITSGDQLLSKFACGQTTFGQVNLEKVKSGALGAT